MNRFRFTHRATVTIVVLLGSAVTGCTQQRYFPERATRPYPGELHTTNTVDIQVFRDGPTLEIVNSTAKSYRDFDLWVNQRYVKHIELLQSGETMRVSLRDFYDKYGEVIAAGGFFRSVEAMPVRLVEIQRGAEQPMIGLITIPGERDDDRES